MLNARRLSMSQKSGLLLSGERGLGESNTGTVKYRSRDHITSTLKLKSESPSAVDLGLNCIVDKILIFKIYLYV